MKKTMISTLKNSTAIVAFGVCLLALVFLPYPTQAQDAVTLSVSPTIFDMTGTPGQTWSSTVRVINVNDFELKIFVEPANFVPKGEGGVPQFKPLVGDPTEEGSFAKWLSLNQEVTIGPEKTVEVPFTITVPENAAPGGHYAALMIRTRPSAPAEGESVVQTSQVVSSLIFLRVTGDVLENSSIRSFRTTNYIVSRPETTFELRIENRGNVHVQPQGEITIYNMWGQERGVVPVNQKTLLGNVLPQSVRKFSFEWKGDWSLSDIGRYTAVTTLAYGVDARQFMSADTAFWVIPWKFLFIVFFGLFAFFKLFSWGIKLYIRKMLALAGVPLENQSAPQIVVTAATKTKRGRPRKMAEVVAPLEVGILDLRSRLKNTKTFKTTLLAIGVFIKAYWKFFVVTIATIVFLVLVFMFVKGALTPSRDFEVTIQGEGESVTMTREDIDDSKEISATTESPEVIKTLVPISLVNRSGEDDALEIAKDTLTQAGFVVGDMSTDTGPAQEKTVVVYDQDNEQLALEISALFDNALLSAFTNNTSGDDEVVVYIGSQAVKKGE